jgi:hypothetical protein
MTESAQGRSEMSKVLGRLRFERQKRLGDFIRPHGVPKDAWRRKIVGLRQRQRQRRRTVTVLAGDTRRDCRCRRHLARVDVRV